MNTVIIIGKEEIMKKLTLLIAIPLMLVTLAGCTTAGPFVSNISADGRGGINIEKQKVQFNAFLGVVGNTETTNTNIQLTQPSK